MAKVKMKRSFAGSDFVWHIGDVVEVTEGERERLIAGDYAEWVKEEQPRPRISKKKRTTRRSSSSATAKASTKQT